MVCLPLCIGLSICHRDTRYVVWMPRKTNVCHIHVNKKKICGLLLHAKFDEFDLEWFKFRMQLCVIINEPTAWNWYNWNLEDIQFMWFEFWMQLCIIINEWTYCMKLTNSAQSKSGMRCLFIRNNAWKWECFYFFTLRQPVTLAVKSGMLCDHSCECVSLIWTCAA